MCEAARYQSELGIDTEFKVSSTNANATLAAGIPSICIGFDAGQGLKCEWGTGGFAATRRASVGVLGYPSRVGGIWRWHFRCCRAGLGGKRRYTLANRACCGVWNGVVASCPTMSMSPREVGLEQPVDNPRGRLAEQDRRGKEVEADADGHFRGARRRPDEDEEQGDHENIEHGPFPQMRHPDLEAADGLGRRPAIPPDDREERDLR